MYVTYSMCFSLPNWQLAVKDISADKQCQLGELHVYVESQDIFDGEGLKI